MAVRHACFPTCTRPAQIASRSLSCDPTNGSVPVSNTWSSTPADQTSPGFPYCLRWITSGAMKCGHPTRPGRPRTSSSRDKESDRCWRMGKTDLKRGISDCFVSSQSIVYVREESSWPAGREEREFVSCHEFRDDRSSGTEKLLAVRRGIGDRKRENHVPAWHSPFRLSIESISFSEMKEEGIFRFHEEICEQRIDWTELWARVCMYVCVCDANNRE